MLDPLIDIKLNLTKPNHIKIKKTFIVIKKYISKLQCMYDNVKIVIYTFKEDILIQNIGYYNQRTSRK